VSGCAYNNNFGILKGCVNNQQNYLNTCLNVVTSTVAYDAQNQLIPSEFDNCMNNPEIKNGEAKQSLYDLRAVYVGYTGIQSKANNINNRVQYSNDRNATVTEWLERSGDAEQAARISQSALYTASCFDPIGNSTPWGIGSAIAVNAACAGSGAVDICFQENAGAVSTEANVEMEEAEHVEEVANLLLDQSELLIDAYAAIQQWYAKKAQVNDLLEGLTGNLNELERQLAYFQHCPANDPSFRMVRDSSRMQLAKQMEYAARMSYLAARRAEYAYAARLSASNFRISDIYRARTADDIKRYLQTMLGVTNSLAGGASYQTDPNDITISIAQHWLQLTDEALAKEGFTTPAAAQAERTRRFREWVAANTFTNTDGKEVLQFNFTTSLLDGGLFSNVILQGYDGYWLHKLSGIAEPKLTNNGVSLNLISEEADMYYRTTRLTQGGLVHLQSHSGCTFDYRLMAPAVLLGLEWASNQDPEAATATFKANVNETYPYTTNGFRTSAFLGRSVSSTDWEITIFAGAPSVGMADMDLQQLNDIELNFSTTYASRQPGDPEPSECTRIDW
jgi:hypothetical protein